MGSSIQVKWDQDWHRCNALALTSDHRAQAVYSQQTRMMPCESPRDTTISADILLHMQPRGCSRVTDCLSMTPSLQLIRCKVYNHSASDSSNLSSCICVLAINLKCLAVSLSMETCLQLGAQSTLYHSQGGGE